MTKRTLFLNNLLALKVAKVNKLLKKTLTVINYLSFLRKFICLNCLSINYEHDTEQIAAHVVRMFGSLRKSSRDNLLNIFLNVHRSEQWRVWDSLKSTHVNDSPTLKLIVSIPGMTNAQRENREGVLWDKLTLVRNMWDSQESTLKMWDEETTNRRFMERSHARLMFIFG